MHGGLVQQPKIPYSRSRSTLFSRLLTISRSIRNAHLAFNPSTQVRSTAHTALLPILSCVVPGHEIGIPGAATHPSSSAHHSLAAQVPSISQHHGVFIRSQARPVSQEGVLRPPPGEPKSSPVLRSSHHLSYTSRSSPMSFQCWHTPHAQPSRWGDPSLTQNHPRFLPFFT